MWGKCPQIFKGESLGEDGVRGQSGKPNQNRRIGRFLSFAEKKAKEEEIKKASFYRPGRITPLKALTQYIKVEQRAGYALSVPSHHLIVMPARNFEQFTMPIVVPYISSKGVNAQHSGRLAIFVYMEGIVAIKLVPLIDC